VLPLTSEQPAELDLVEERAVDDPDGAVGPRRVGEPPSRIVASIGSKASVLA